MNQPCLPPDDLPSLDPSFRELSWELEEVVGEIFYNDCNPTIQDLLRQCGWDVTIRTQGLTLVVICPNNSLNWQILQSIPLFADILKVLSNSAKIRIYPPPGTGTPMDVVVQDSF
ncbi:hypothetical protein [Crocosphaera sp. Alani8]|uniref:hypothetical protein n=1 Tax=Crocosphaera sp. Alani8 TaxID=3038952 RepID=UPI00313B8D29